MIKEIKIISILLLGCIFLAGCKGNITNNTDLIVDNNKQGDIENEENDLNNYNVLLENLLSCAREDNSLEEWCQKILNGDLNILKKYEEETLQFIRENPVIIFILPDGWSGRKDLIKEIVGEYPHLLQDFSEELRNDFDIVKAAVDNDYGDAIKYASAELRDNKDLAILSVSKNGETYQYLSERMKLDKDVIASIKNTDTSGYNKLGFNLAWLPEDLLNDKEFLLKFLKDKGLVNLCAAPAEMQDDKDIVKKAVSDNGLSLKCVSTRLQDDPEIALVAIREHPDSCEFISDRLKGDKDFALEAIKVHGWVIGCFNDDLHNDYNIMLAAVLEDWRALEYASDELKDNKLLVINAAVQSKDALKYASPRLQEELKDVDFTIDPFGVNSNDN